MALINEADRGAATRPIYQLPPAFEWVPRGSRLVEPRACSRMSTAMMAETSQTEHSFFSSLKSLQIAFGRSKVNHMVQYQFRLDITFAALSDVTRRGVLEQLWRSHASITELAQRFDMTLTGMKKHVSLLEEAGLVVTEKIGRVRTCKLGPRRLEEEAAWIEQHRELWVARFDALDVLVEQLKSEEKADDQSKRR
jgi:DNA-binding transcriptional ArsR family regulator